MTGTSAIFSSPLIVGVVLGKADAKELGRVKDCIHELEESIEESDFAEPVLERAIKRQKDTVELAKDEARACELQIKVLYS